MAGFGGFKVISVDYRMPPEAYFPAALDDGVTVYKNTLKATDAKNIAIFGTSAGGCVDAGDGASREATWPSRCRAPSRQERRCPT